MRLTPATELEYRCHKLQKLMQTKELDAIIIVQNADLFYFTGTTQNGCLYIPSNGQPIYMVRKNFMRARMESGLKEVVPFITMLEIPSILSDFSYPQPQKIGMELDVVPVNFFEKYRMVYPNALFQDSTDIIRQVRMIKSHYELHLMQDAADQAERIFKRAEEVIHEGMTDLQLAAELEYVARKDGHQGLIRMRGFNSELFYAQIFSGTDTAVPSYSNTPLGGMGLNTSFGQGAGLNKIAHNEPIIVDFGASTDGYLIDQTRIFSIGEIDPILKKGYADMCAIQEYMTTIATPLVSWGTLYDKCLAMAIEMGYEDNFMGAKGSQVSFIGHGLGIEIDEYPFIARGFNNMLFEVGMVFAFEPKLVFPGLGAIGIENTYYFSHEGLKKLTRTSDALILLSK